MPLPPKTLHHPIRDGSIPLSLSTFQLVNLSTIYILASIPIKKNSTFTSSLPLVNRYLPPPLSSSLNTLKMKHRSLSLSLAGILAILLTACSGNEQKTTTDSTSMSTDTSTQTTTQSTPSASTPTTATVMVAKHKVANFNKWLASYDDHDSMRVAAGLHNFVIGRGIPDSNMVMVALKVDDTAKAKSFAKDPSLKKAMQQGGVIGTPNIMIYNTTFLDNGQASNLRVMSTETVKDWEAWKTAFEGGKQIRTENGLMDRAYGYDINDNHKISVVLALTDSAKGSSFLKSDTIKKRMAAAGVVGQPNRYYYHVVKTY